VYAFISYQTGDKIVAGKVKDLLLEADVSSFMAHEDINVSEEWRLKILEEIGKAELFVSLWSKNYNSSWWCIQESGIASFRKDLTVIPLSTDGSRPQGFASNIQSISIDPTNLSLSDLMPGLIKADSSFGLKLIFKSIAGSKSYRGAEVNFKQVLPYLDILTPEQGKELLEISIGNDQIHHAGLCASEYLPPIMAKHGTLLEAKDYSFLSEILNLYVA